MRRVLFLPPLLGCFLVLLATAAQPQPVGIVFMDASKAAGLIDPLTGLMGHGGAWGDFDNDGNPDIYAGGFCDRPDKEYAPAKGPVLPVLLRNKGDGTFAVVRDTPTAVAGRASGALFVDLDNDGWSELYVANNARAKAGKAGEPQASAVTRRTQLFRNDRGKLIDISKECGACPDSLLTARNIGAFDYDLDGKLDLLIVEDRFTRNPRTTLFHNEGGLKFRDVTKEVGLPENAFGLGLAVADVNEDGRPDFLLPHSNTLFLSTAGGKFREATELRDVFAWKTNHNEDWPCGACFADLNRDGRPDLVLSIHHVQARNKVYLHRGLKDGVPVYEDITRAAGLDKVVPTRCPHVEVQDFDNDGWPDIYVSAGWLEGDTFTPLIYRHQGLKDGVPTFSPPRPIQEPMVYYPAGPSADYDGDGRVDLFLVNWFMGNHSRLLHNESPAKNWLAVGVTGTKKVNRMGLGAKLSVYPAGKLGQAAALLGSREVQIGYGYASGHLPIVHFGLGDVKRVDVRAILPGGAVVERKDVLVNQRLQIEEP